MISDNESDLILGRLEMGLPGITPAVGRTYAEACAICLESQGHASGVSLGISGTVDVVRRITYPVIDNQMRKCWQDEEVTTERGACGIAMLLTTDYTQYTVVEVSKKGTGFDYWLGDPDSFPFQRKARLEVSGIRNGNDSTIKARVSKKIKQSSKSNEHLPGYVVVVEFSKPLARMVEK